MLICGDCLEEIAKMEPSSIDAIVTDPPYGLRFMGKAWDHGLPGAPFWVEALRVAKPGAHLLAFGGTRTFHRLACAIEDAGWEIRDTLGWLYGSGFPKSHDVSKAIDKVAGVEREATGRVLSVTGNRACPSPSLAPSGLGAIGVGRQPHMETSPVTAAARQWSGWGTALKPAWEPIILARKPLEGTVAENVQRYGTGAINVDGCRVGTNGEAGVNTRATRRPNGTGWGMQAQKSGDRSGRWPANILHDGSEEVVAVMGEAARFFYCAKASKRDRDEGLQDGQHSNHPTVKPTSLMRYLCRLVTPPGGVILDPFMGSGSTGKAAILEGFNFIGIEKEREYVEIARARIEHAQKQGVLNVQA